MEDSLFTRIIKKQIPAKFAYEDDRYIVIHDLQPQAPVHLLVIQREAPNDRVRAEKFLAGSSQARV